MWRKRNGGPGATVAESPPRSKDDRGPAAYWAALLNEAHLTRARQDARIARLEVAAGVVVAATAALGVARFDAPRAVDCFDLLFGLALASALLFSVLVIWPRPRSTFKPEAVRLDLEARGGRRDTAELIGTLYHEARKANDAGEESLSTIHRRFRYALLGLVAAAVTLLGPTMLAMLLNAEGGA